jgi:anti-anti-sigma regulatory factor
MLRFLDMLRITENFDDVDSVALRLDGVLSNETYADLERIFSRHRSAGPKTVVIDMQGVTFLNEEAARKLAQLFDQRVRVVNCSPFVAMLLETVAEEH